MIGRIGFMFVAVVAFCGCQCQKVATTPEIRKFNAEFAEDTAELFAVPFDDWIELEIRNGLDNLGGRARIARRHLDEIPDANNREQTRQFLTQINEEANLRLVGALMAMHEIRSKMNRGDRLYYCRKGNETADSYGSFYIIRNGKVREKLHYRCTWGIANEWMWEGLWSKAEKQFK